MIRFRNQCPALCSSGLYGTLHVYFLQCCGSILLFFSETQKSDDTLECDSLIGLLDVVCFDRLENSLDDLGFWNGLRRLSSGLLACSGL